MPPSSTSSSEPGGFPWAGLAALVLVVAFDRVAFSHPATWEWALEAIPPSDTMEHGVANDRNAQLALDAVDEHPRPHVMLVGNSRVNRGLIKPIIARSGIDSGGTLTKLAHGGVRPYDLACMLDELGEHEPDLVVTVITEFETHRPMQFLTHMGNARRRTYLDLLTELELPDMLGDRDGLLGMGLATLLDGYRFRRQMGSARLDDYRRFPKLLREGRPAYTEAPVAVHGDPPLELNVAEAMKTFKRELPDAPLIIIRRQVEQSNSVTTGAHAELQQALLERALMRLVEAGSDVLIVEAPIHPEAVALYAPAAREQARAWARGLAEHEQVHWLPVETFDPLPDDCWADLSHLSRPASERMSNVAAKHIKRILGERAARH